MSVDTGHFIILKHLLHRKEVTARELKKLCVHMNRNLALYDDVISVSFPIASFLQTPNLGTRRLFLHGGTRGSSDRLTNQPLPQRRAVFSKLQLASTTSSP